MFVEISPHDEIDGDVNYLNQVYPSLHEDGTNQSYDSNSYSNLISQYDDREIFSLSSEYQIN